MSRADKGKLDQNKTLVEPDVPTVPFSQTTDFSVSTNAGMSDPDTAQVDVYSTQFADRTVPTGSTEKGDTGKSSVASGGLSSSKNQLPVDIPGFVVESELGRGAFGVVYCARDQFLDRRVAIKKPLISNPAHRQQYIDEARKAVKLDHPSIVPIYQVGMTSNDEPFVVQKLIEGSTLRDLLKNSEGRLPLLQTVSIMRQVCLAVNAAHVAGIVHRDLKPENLLVEPEGRVYVADFGLAILEDDEQNKKGREVAGTPLYMSPEQFAGRVEWLDGRSDIWALGVILYELLSGKTPFSGSSLNELKDQIKNKDPRPIHQRDPKVPSAFDAMFRKCCAKNVGDRYASAGEMIAELDVITESLPYLDTINLMSQARTGSFKGLSSSVGSGIGSAVGSGQGGLSSRGLSAYGSAQSTVRNSMGGATIRELGTARKLLAPFLITVAILGTLTCAAWIAKLGPFAAVPSIPDPINKNGNVEPVPVDRVPQTGIGNSVAGTTDNKSPEPKVEPKPLPPSKPFTVSINSKGTHESIAKAIADSDAGETIRIHAGTYRESLVIDRSIKIVGDGAVIIRSTEKSCIKIQADSQVDIENVTIDCQAANFNAIDIVVGKLSLDRCVVFASSLESYNCIKVRPNSIFVADKCKFQSTLDVNVSGEIKSIIAIRDSSFSFSGNADSGKKRIGLQAKGSQGLIQRCSFTGPCIGGIDWMESPDQNLTIESCQFDNCDTSIQARTTNNVVIKGTADDPCVIRNAVWGLSIKQSQVDLNNVNVEGASDRNRVAMQITEDSKVKCTSCDFSGTACGILLNRSSIAIENVSIRETSFVGMLVDGGIVDGDVLSLKNVSSFGLVVLSKDASVMLNELTVEARVSKPMLTPAVYVSSGIVEFNKGVFANCLCGIFVDPSREIINGVRYPEKRSLDEIVLNPALITRTPVEVNSDIMTLKNCDNGWIFNGIGSSRVKQLAGDISEKHRTPFLLNEDFELNSKDSLAFSVVKKTLGK